MPRKNPTAGQYILSFLAGALPGYIHGKIAKQQQEREANKPKELDIVSKMQIDNLYSQYNNTSLSPDERNEAGQFLSQLGFVVPEARALPQKQGITPEEEKIHETAVKAINEAPLREARIAAEKSRRAYYNRLRSTPQIKTPPEDRKRERTRQEISVEIDALEQQRKGLTRDIFGELTPKDKEKDDYYVSEIEKRRRELQVLGKRGAATVEEKTTDQLLMEAIKQLNDLIGE